ncbi:MULTISPECIES: hypothetical protein [Chryseobacterium]|uniref:hypothetical protein n=2 Tax=Chryseobacterium group TaxID=2782232 RepID=UPI0023583D3C|nr:hypothetical protein [Chryseobacterium sp. B21-037]MDC8103252.1 hypothetical protein [Chryseobacterium sp. B21-037]WBV56802.1 hypothetical protein PFY10_21710 [Chryseobacterium daecheongense]
MMEKDFNPVIKAVQNLRKLSTDITLTHKEIVEGNDGIIKKIDEAGELIVLFNDCIIINLWLNEKAKLLENIIVLLGILRSIEDKFINKDRSNLLEIRQAYNHYKDVVINILIEMQNVGNSIFTAENLQKWDSIWEIISKNLNRILSTSESYKLKLTLMENLEPDEIDALTLDILKYIPWSYPDSEDQNYERQYAEAYDELNQSLSEKKNVWNKVLSVLAGGMDETSAHRLSIKR